MKKNFIIISTISLLFVLLFACEKEEEKAVAPKVVTASVDSIYNTFARVGGNVSSDGGAEITERGIYWGTLPNPEGSGTKFQIGTGTGIYQDVLTGLTPGSKYYVKAYATNIKGTSYGEETFFTTQIHMPTVTTAIPTDLTLTSARVGGNVTDDGGYEVSQRGVYWSTSTNPILTGNKLLIGSGEGEFSQTLTELDPAVTYYVIAFATNIKGTTYGNEVSFITVPGLASIYTAAPTKITTDSVTIGGNVESNGGSEVTERGFYIGTSTSPQTNGTKLQVGSGSGPFYSRLGDLNPGTTYYYIAYAINGVGASYGEEKSFTTSGMIPTAVTFGTSDILATSAKVAGKIETNELLTTVTFEYGTTTSYGNSIEAIGSPTIQDIDTLSVTITGLLPLTTYYYRVKAENELGTVYGGDSTFTTVLTGITGTVSDNDGNDYNTIGIGKLYWMRTNLKTTKYNDGTEIALVSNDSLWSTLNTPAYCWYQNDSLEYSGTYGALYNWYTVNTNKLCPTGWRLPTNDEITELFKYLGGANVAGSLLKEAGNSHWNSSSSESTDQYSFTALPGGNRTPEGIFDFIGVQGNWWTASNYSTLTALYFYMLYDYNNSFQSFINKKNGLSVRCVKD